jgi:uncharacterized protein (TIGR00661 family)
LSSNDILVYFPFCDKTHLIEWFAPHSEYNFHIFHGSDEPSGYSNIHLYAFSRSHFQEKQRICAGVITAAGFELPSEALQLGQKLLRLPLDNQMEQQSNAKALAEIGRATILNNFCKGHLIHGYNIPLNPPFNFPTSP